MIQSAIRYCLLLCFAASSHGLTAQEQVRITSFIVPITLIHQRIDISDAGDYFSYGYENVAGQFYLRPTFGVDAYTDRIEVPTKMIMTFQTAATIAIYNDKGVVKKYSFSPYEKVSVNALVSADVYLGDTFLGSHEWDLSGTYGNCVSFDERIIIKKDVLDRYDKAKSASGIGGGSNKTAASILKDLRFMSVTINKFKQGLPDNITKEARAMNFEDRKRREAKENPPATVKSGRNSETGAETKNTTSQPRNPSETRLSQDNNSSAPTKNANGDQLPDLAMTTDGKYYKRGSDGQYREISRQEFESQRKRQGANTTKATASSGPSAEDIQKQIQKSTDDYWAGVEESNRRIETETHLQMQSFYAGQRLRDARSNAAEASTLGGNYATVEEMEAAFQEKYRTINVEYDNVNRARNEALQANVAASFYGADANGQALGQTVTGIGTIVNDVRAEKEKAAAREALQKQRSEQLAKFEAKKKELNVKMRRAFLSEFPDGGLPLSSHTVGTREVYLFFYVTEGDLQQDKPALMVSNIFPVQQYDDGTWPFRKTIASEVQHFESGGELVMVGYYASKQVADETRNSFLRLATQCKFLIQHVSYSGKTHSQGDDIIEDFWNEGKPSTQENPAGQDAPKPSSSPKEDDFWNN